MSTISEKLTQLNTIKGDIKTAINNKGGEVGNDFSTYATAINNLSTGSGGSGETYENPEFYEVRTQKGTNYNYLFYGYSGPDIDVSQWDTSKVTSARYCFSYCAKSMDISNWDLSSLTNAERMFTDCSATITGLENMDFSNLANAVNMFERFVNGNKYIDLSVLDFSSVTKASNMFSYSNTNYLDVRNINLTGTTSYSGLFSSCQGTELDLSNWDISKINDLSNLYYFSGYKKINLTGWNTVNVKNMGYVFYYCSYLETLLIPDWDMTNATSTSNFIYSCSKLKYIDLSRSNNFTVKKIASFLPTKTATAYGEVVISANTSQDAIDALIAKYWKPIGPKFDLTSTELVLELDEIKPGKTTKVWNCNNDPWYGDDKLETIEFISSDESIATVNGREIRGVAEGTVTIKCRRREDNVIISTAPVTLTVSETDSNPNLIKFRTTGSEYIYGTILTINGTSIATNECTKNPITGIYSYDPGTQITSISFSDYVNEIVKFNFNALNITDMSHIFKDTKIKTIDVSDWDTSNASSMCGIFEYNTELIEIIGELDMSKVSSVRDMFHYTSNLEVVYLKNIYKNCTMSNNGNWSIDLGDTKVKDECLLYIINELPDLYAKGLTSTSLISFTLPPTNTLTQEQIAVGIAKGWTFVNVNY